MPGRDSAPTVSVVIPTLNEALNLPHVLPRLPAMVTEVVIVDGDSTDGTIDVALALRPDARIVRQVGRGKGSALRSGFAEARGDIIVSIDADGSTDPDEIELFVEALVSGADYVKGSRFLQGGGSTDLTRLRSSGNLGLTYLVRVVHGARFTDLCYGYNAFWADVLPLLDLRSTGFEIETEMNLRAHHAGLRIVEVPSQEVDRIHGTSNLRPFHDGWRVLKMILRERVRQLPTWNRVDPVVVRPTDEMTVNDSFAEAG
jgi:glycosyltransferase involved in cell wall biosynthesis